MGYIMALFQILVSNLTAYIEVIITEMEPQKWLIWKKLYSM